MTIRVLLADDQALLRSAFRVLVDSEPDMEVVGEASDGVPALALAARSGADVVLMDIRMPGTDGLTATRMISADPALAEVRVVMLTTFEVDDYVVERCGPALPGASARIPPGGLLDGIRLVAPGRRCCRRPRPRGCIATLPRAGRQRGRAAGRPRTPSGSPRSPAREREVLVLVAGGLLQRRDRRASAWSARSP